MKKLNFSLIAIIMSLGAFANAGTSVYVCNEKETSLQYRVELSGPSLFSPFTKKAYKVYLIQVDGLDLISEKGLDAGNTSHIEWGNYFFNPNSPHFLVVPPTPEGYSNFRLTYYKDEGKSKLSREMHLDGSMPTKSLDYRMDCTKQ